MARYYSKRLGIVLITLFLLSIVVFVLPRVAGDPVYLLLPSDASEEDRQELREELGLTKSLPEQYWIFLKGAVQGDFGESVYIRQPVTELIADRFPATLKLAAATFVFALPLGILLGILAAIRKNRWPDLLARSVAVAGQSLPNFWIGIMLILLFSVTWELLPTSGIGGPDHYVLPVITLGWVGLAGVTRLTRSSMLEVLGSDYITFLRASGIPEKSVVLKHALRNAAIPVVTMAAIMFGYLLTGSIVVESVFAWPGMGRLAYESVARADFPLIQGIVLFYGVIFISLNLLADLFYSWIDPRIRYQ
ncbi:MAG: ABC transporter permease [Chloroflexi bacterium]|nr:ABC transporter permease [Chloroflexota bacterium]